MPVVAPPRADLRKMTHTKRRPNDRNLGFGKGEKETGAGDESRTRDLNLGKVALYQLSYSRSEEDANFTESESLVKQPAQIFAESSRFRSISAAISQG